MKHAIARRRVPALVLTVLMALGGIMAPAAVRPAQAADATLVFAALNVLVANHVSEPDPIKLLAAALDEVRQMLARAGIAGPLANVTATSETQARAEFQARFDRAVAAAQGRITETQLQYAAVRAMAASLDDSHTAFISPEQWDEIRRRNQGQAAFSGIGILLLFRDGRYYIKHVLPRSPAARVGLRDLDRIVAVDGQSTQGMSREDFSGRVRGPQGTTVLITVQRAGETGSLTFSVTREPIVTTIVEHSMLDGGVGYIRFPQFVLGSADQFRRALEDLQRQGMRGLVLDLRSNGGGFVGEVVQIASMLLPAGLPIMVREGRREGKTTDVTTGGPLLDPSSSLVVLVDESTFSGAEVLGAAIQEYERGTLVGVQTGGAVLSSRYFLLPGGAAIQVATSRVLTGKGVVLERNGVGPDTVVDLATDDLDRGVDSQLERALQIATERVPASRIVRYQPSALAA